MITRVSFADAPVSPARPRVGLACLMTAHMAADVLMARVLSLSLGLQEFGLTFALILGLAWGQATLLGQFLLLGARRPVSRTFVVAAWFGLIVYLGGPAFRATGAPSALVGGCFFIDVPLVCSAMIGMARRGRGCRIISQWAGANHADGEVFQFSLRHLFKLTLCAAIVLGVIRTVAEAFENSAWLFLLFGFPPLANVLAWQPRLCPWAALGDRHPAWRSAAVLSLAITSAFVPVFIGRALPTTYWIIACPVVVQSLVITGSLLIVRRLGYRLIIDAAFANYPQIRRHPPRY